MKDTKRVLRKMVDGRPYATAISSVLENITPKSIEIPLSETVNSVLGMSGLPNRMPTNEQELIDLCEALAAKVLAYSLSDEDDAPDYLSLLNQYRARYQPLTDDEILDFNDKSIFERLHDNVERMAVASVLTDVAVDRGLHVPPLWKTILTNMGGI